MARVIYRDDNYQTVYVDVNVQNPEVTVGRNAGNAIVIPAKSLSRYHAKIVFQNGRYFLIDLKSSNGSYVNGARVTQQEIRPGDKLAFGEVGVEFTEAPASGAGAMAGPVAAGAMGPGPMNVGPLGPGPMGAGPMPGAMGPGKPAGFPGADGQGMGGPKLAGPKLQMFNPGLPMGGASSDPRNINVRPISNPGNYRPTMPNQPSFDQDMELMLQQQQQRLNAQPGSAPSQVPASQGMGEGQQMGMDPSLAPRTFDPSTMGYAPGMMGTGMGMDPHQAPERRVTSSASMAPAPSLGGGMDPSLAPRTFDPAAMAPAPSLGGGMDPALAPRTFEPDTMGYGPGGVGAGMGLADPYQAPMPSGRTAPPAPGFGGMDPAFAPRTFDVNTMGYGGGVGAVQPMAWHDQGLRQHSASWPDAPEGGVFGHAEPGGEHEKTGLGAYPEVPEEEAFQAGSGLSQEANQSGDGAQGAVSDYSDIRSSEVELERQADLYASRQRTRIGREQSGALSSMANRRLAPRAGQASSEVAAPRVSQDASTTSGILPARATRGRERHRGGYAPQAARVSMVGQGSTDGASISDENLAQEISDLDVMSLGSAEQAPLAVEEMSLSSETRASSSLSIRVGAELADGMAEAPDDFLPNVSGEPKSEILTCGDLLFLEEGRGSCQSSEDGASASVSFDNGQPGEAGGGYEGERLRAVNAEQAEVLNTYRQLSAQLSEQNDALSAKLELKRAEIEALRQHEKENDGLRQSIVQLEEGEALLREQLAQTQSREASLRQELDEAHRQLAEYQSEAEQAQRRIDEAEAQCHALGLEVNHLKDRNNDPFVVLWRERFGALERYAASLECATHQLDLESIDPKALENVRSMREVIAFCATSLSQD
ncbi:MAG: FHA domain-containing protein [Proteobacteria bacterium]|nr:FHA domain-containing protein [Pseudomonadota bacterium]